VALVIATLAHLHKPLFGISESALNCQSWVPRERVFFDHVVVQVVSQKLRANRPAMAVVNPKERAFRPVLVYSVLWLDDIQDNADTVFIIVPDETLVCVGSICSDYSVAFKTTFGYFVVRDHDPHARLQLG